MKLWVLVNDKTASNQIYAYLKGKPQEKLIFSGPATKRRERALRFFYGFLGLCLIL